MGFEVTRQCEIWPPPFLDEPDHRFKLKKELLVDCIGIGAGAMSRPGKIAGFNYGKGLGYALLAYFASQALGFRRLPFMEDRIYHNYMGMTPQEFLKELPQLNDKVIDGAIAEASELYRHTQKKLSDAGLTHISLRRNISARESEGYAEHLMRLVAYSEVVGAETISFEMDTINSYTDEGAYGHLADVVIEHKFPAEDIFYCSNLVERENPGDRSRLVETGEWLVINRSTTGIVTLPTDSIKFNRANFKIDIERSPKFFEGYLKRNTPCVYRANDEFPPHYLSAGVRPSWRWKLAQWLLDNNSWR